MSLVDAQGVTVRFQTAQGTVHACQDVSLRIAPGEAVGLVGESGSGKSTLGRALLRLCPLEAGAVRFDGQDLAALGPAALRALRRRMQPVFQDPLASLDPRLTMGAALREALRAAGVPEAEWGARTGALLASLGVPLDAEGRLPRELSAGQRQRVCIARAMASDPAFLVLDEPVSALDVSVQAQIAQVLTRLRDERGLAWLFISHDLSLVAHLCSRMAVMLLGRVVEQGPTAQVVDSPRHPYTRALLAAIPARTPSERRPHAPLPGEPPSPLRPPRGCAFHTRCPRAQERCRAEVPRLEGDVHQVACFFPEAGP